VAGAEIAQLYATLPADSGEPPKRLIGFNKLSLAPVESKPVSVTVKAERLAIWDTTAKQWRLPDGNFTFFVGASSRDPQALTSTQTIKGRLLASSK
jgi:beta-glucosidase